ncbi:MAG: fructose-bisphosphatase class II, partial [Patescibacteria group bacterium]|nr:fructose-bisphosphatase class II [Patescibacteria group bacterium]
MLIEARSGTGIPSEPRLTSNPDLLPQKELSLTEVLSHYNLVTAAAAAQARLAIDVKYALGKPLADDDQKAFAIWLDRKATHSMEQLLHQFPFISRVVDCEGEKENRKDRESGNGSADLPVLKGSYGMGSFVLFSERHVLDTLDSASRVELVIDPIEGTTRASLNQEGAVAVMAGTLTGYIASIPPEDSPALYADRIVASRRLMGKVSLDRSPRENVRAVMKEFGLTNPADVKVLVMDRPRNKELIDALRAEGIVFDPKTLIKSGDLMPAIEVLTQDKPILSMSSGGKTEAVIAACGAKALGGVFEMRYVSGQGKPVEEFPGLLTLDDVVSGNPADFFVNFASVTGVPKLGLPVPEVRGDNFIVPVAAITSKSAGL